jgi:hypothetical protein
VEKVGYEEEGGGTGEVPAVAGVGEKDECAMPDGEYQLDLLTDWMHVCLMSSHFK